MLLAQVITTALVFKSDLQTEIVAPETVVSICDWVLFVSFLIMLLCTGLCGEGTATQLY